MRYPLRILLACGLTIWRTLATAADTTSASMKLVILGTGTPNADPERSGPELAIIKDDQAYLVDSGPGMVRRAAAAAKKHSLEALKPKRLDIVFLTHLHSDHTLGVPDLIYTPWVLERQEPLRLFGPSGSRRMVRHLQYAYREDVRIRLRGLEPANETGHRVKAVDVKQAGVVFESSVIRIETVPVLHGSWRQAFGYRISDGITTIVISRDARPSPQLLRAAKGAHILVHEVYSAERFKTLPQEWKAYHASFHTSTRELAALAAEARPSLLVLYHQLYWNATDEDLVREVREFGYKGRVVSARDLDIFQ